MALINEILILQELLSHTFAQDGSLSIEMTEWAINFRILFILLFVLGEFLEITLIIEL